MVSLLITVIVVALIFDYINGFHDSANAIATTVSTGVMSLAAAVVLAGVFNFIGAVAGTAVAKFIAGGIAEAANVDQLVVLAALLGASAWNLITWWYGIPSSSSHALVGGIAGAVIAHAGWGAVKWAGIWQKVLLPLVVSPILGFAIALIVMIIAFWIVRRMRPGTVNRGSRGLQLVSACTFAFSHGSNDAQKAMGIITLALVAFVGAHGTHLPAWMEDIRSWFLPRAHVDAHGKTINDVPYWVMISCALAMALGTMAGGKRIIKTMGAKIYRINPLQGFAAQTSGTAVILSASHLGIPISTTHCISAAIMGAGVSKRVSAVRWGVAINILIAWILTLPLSALVAYACMIALRWIFGSGV
jgi:inorganic phosphate transporter, PiT family